jgi:hypothetical protein
MAQECVRARPRTIVAQLELTRQLNRVVELAEFHSSGLAFSTIDMIPISRSRQSL